MNSGGGGAYPIRSMHKEVVCVDYHDFLGEVLISEDQLQARIAELGAEISRDYQDKNLLLICILRGGVMFLTDLMRQISLSACD